MQPGISPLDGFSFSNKPHGPARCRRVACNDEGNGNARLRQETAHRLSDAARTHDGDAPEWFVFPHLNGFAAFELAV
jgi:hypothetical protein